MDIVSPTEKAVGLGLIALTVLLAILKLLNVITWSWLVVTSPLWGTVLVLTITFNLAMIVVLLSNEK